MNVIMRTEHLHRRFPSGSGEVHAVNNVTMSIPKGSLTILCGPSGSGKTTLLNLLGGLDLPSAGHIYFHDDDMTSLPESARDGLRRTRMGFVFQSIGLISIMTAYENIEFGLRVAGFDPLTREEWAEHCLHSVGMYKRRHHRPYELSGGEQQRIAIARAIAHNPDIIFADEPTSALDTMLGLKVIKLFKELSSEKQVTIVMTTHDPNFLELADHVYTLKDGSIVEGDADG
jgi:putative ABC transport system ATP-binding protein